MKREIDIFFTALSSYTRIPVYKNYEFSTCYLQKSIRYLPLIGWIVGESMASIYLACHVIFPPTISLILAFIGSILLTGGFHEDGLADVCDGFGGGWTKEKILHIMKDSRVGTYGVLGLVLIMVLKFFVLLELMNQHPSSFITMIIFIQAHTMSRFIALTTMMSHEYARNDTDAKVKNMTQKISWKHPSFWIPFMTTLLPCIVLPNILLLLIPMYMVKWKMMRFFTKWIGGYTGDCLGAIQQVCEVIFYLGVYLLWKYI